MHPRKQIGLGNPLGQFRENRCQRIPTSACFRIAEKGPMDSMKTTTDRTNHENTGGQKYSLKLVYFSIYQHYLLDLAEQGCKVSLLWTMLHRRMSNMLSKFHRNFLSLILNIDNDLVYTTRKKGGERKKTKNYYYICTITRCRYQIRNEKKKMKMKKNREKYYT